jgi:rRNA maturation RNase YbeY
MKRVRIAPRRPALSLQFFNRQKTRRINLVFCRQVLRGLLDQELPGRKAGTAVGNVPLRGALGIHFIDAVAMAKLNETFLGHTGSTDVITFNYQEDPAADALCGEIFISVDDAVACAPRFRTIWQLELVRYMVHGVLHLLGYDDHGTNERRVMKKLENRLLKQLSPHFDWGKLERH